MPSKAVYLGLGSNLGEREWFLRRALEELQQSDKLHLTSISPVYETEPVGFADQGKYLNLVAEISSVLAPGELIKYLEQVEARVGKKAEFKNGPREIDIDILLYGREVIAEQDLIIPHPGLSRREFALRPLLDLDPFLSDPVTNSPYSVYLKRIKGDKAVVRRMDLDFGDILTK